VSDQPPDPVNAGGARPDEGATEERPTIAGTLTASLDGSGWAAGEDAGDADEEWVSQATHGIRLGVPVAALLAVVLIAGGFWGGAALYKSHGGASTGSLAGFAARLRSAVGASGATGATASRFGGFGGLGGSAAAAIGTISVVDGDTLYVETTAGSLVKVTLTKSTTITRNADATAIDLRPGDAVTVQGATGGNGTVAATSVSATAPGVSSGFAGFGRGAGGFGATGSTGTGSSTTTTPSLFGG
jgi:hypothetical protein